MRVLTVLGARPQFVKAALLSDALAQRGIEETVVHTGQHYDENMSEVFFRDLRMHTPKYHLQVGSGAHGGQTGRMMIRLEPIIGEIVPDLVLVYGDTNSTIAGALVAAKLNIPVAHVEAGLRSFDRSMPEEINRILTDHVASLLFAPTERSRSQLASEGITDGVFVTGDLMVDLALRTASEPIDERIFERFEVGEGAYAVATVHRASNTNDASAFERIIAGLRALPMPVIFPVHPRTLPLVRQNGVGAGDNILVCEPLSYPEMIALMMHARVVMTDSGGMQKESVVLGTPCVTLRDTTEWEETLENGWNVLAGTNPKTIARTAVRAKPLERIQPFGTGDCAGRIAGILLEGRVEACVS